MTSFTTSYADRLRIAIALTALKFKPAGQSCAAYILELRSVFPSSTPTAPTTDGSWKTHALALEQDLAKLKAKYEAEQIKALSVPTLPIVDPVGSGNQPPKRKPKKKPIDQRLDIPIRADLETVLGDLTGRPDFVSLPSSDSLFSSFSALEQLTWALTTSSTTVTAAQRSLLLATTTRALTALTNLLRPILLSTDITVASQVATLQTLAILVHHLVSSSLPILLRKPKRDTNEPATVSKPLNKLLDALITDIFRPVLESFSPLSHQYLMFLLQPTASAVLPVDLRPGVLHLFQSAFSPLVSASSGYDANFRGTIALIALRALEGLFPARSTGGLQQHWTHDNRVNALVRKDALWYHCTVLHILFAPRNDCPTLGSMLRADEAVSETRIVDALSRILSRCRTSFADGSTDTCNDELSGRDSDIDVGETARDLDYAVIDEVGYGMILSVTERYWRWTGDIQSDMV